MKKTLLLTAMMLLFNILFSQTRSVAFYNWSDNATYLSSTSPIITGYGFYSDSLSDIFGGKTFYEYNGEYYPIDSWADYYYWFIQKFRFKFEDPQLYEYHYWNNDEYGMASYIVSKKYLGNFYPSEITVAFNDKIQDLEINRLDYKYIYNVKKSEEEFKQMEEEFKLLHEQLETKNEQNEKVHKDPKPSFNNPKVFQKDNFRKSEYKKQMPVTETKLKKGSSSSKNTIK